MPFKDCFQLMMRYWRITLTVGLVLSGLVVFTGILIFIIVQVDPITFQFFVPFLWIGGLASLFSICFLIPATLTADLMINLILGIHPAPKARP